MYGTAYIINMHPSDNIAAEQKPALVTVEDRQPAAAVGIPPGIQRSQEAFRRNLPRLLENRKLYRQWAAYHGDELIGFARSETDLYEKCFQRGLKEEEFVVCCVVPEMPADRDVTPLCEV
jgi:hypothetical protein